MKSSDGGEAFKSFAIRNATYEDCSAILECLRPAFAPYRESYTPEAFLDTVLTPQTFRHAVISLKESFLIVQCFRSVTQRLKFDESKWNFQLLFRFAG